MTTELPNTGPVGNVRFWDYVGWRNGYVKITLKPGQSLEHHGGGRTDEGYCWWANTYVYDAEAGIVTYYAETESSDCDGPHSSCRELWCPVDKLAGRDPYKNSPRCPLWTEGEYRQRDYFAESMNY